MFWCDRLVKNIDSPQIINDSKTPSGRVHVGALRGVLIHDAVYKTLKEKQIPVRYLFGVDDYDPLDEIPDGEAEHFEQFLGKPLCNVSPPRDTDASDMAEYYITEFFDIFKELNVKTETYRMRDIYRAGQFNDAIDTILKHYKTVQKIYRDVSNSQRPENWYPFQVICEKCGKIGTTEVIDYDGKEVTYKCREAMVTWAKGCGNTGKISPFDGNGKLPWKLEWIAKWKVLGITIEGAGKDHSTKGGSRDVSSRCLREIFSMAPPLNIPYEFFLVDGAKMSSSKGLGATVRDMADFLPPEILRYLILSPLPNRPVNFSPEEKNIIKLFNDFDRCHTRAHDNENVTTEDKRIYQLSTLIDEGNFYQTNFQLLATLVQMPHLNVEKEIEKHKGESLTDIEKKHLDRRISSVRYWVDNIAEESEKTRLQETLPASAENLTAGQKAFLSFLATALTDTPWNDDNIQSLIFETSRLTPIPQPKAFQAVYCIILDRKSGPKAGNLLAVLDQEFVINMFSQMTFSQEELWRETAIPKPEFEKWLDKESSKIETCSISTNNNFIDFHIVLNDARKLIKRMNLDEKSVDDNIERLATELNNKFNLNIEGNFP